MTPNNLEVLLLILLFFLPGYIYFLVKSWFEFQSWKNKEMLFLSFLFNSLIFQFISWNILKLFQLNILNSLSNYESLNIFITSNFWTITAQLTMTVFLSILVAIVASLKQIKRFIGHIQFTLKHFLNIGLQYTPSFPSVFEYGTNFGQKYIGCVVELKDGTLYDGNIFHIGFNTENKDHLIVLRSVTRMQNGKRKKFPDELKILIPYDNINTIAYKEYPITNKTTNSNSGFLLLSPLNLSLILILILVLLLCSLQQQITNLDFLKIIIELFGAFVVTFLGVYISMNYTKQSEREKGRKEREKIYLGSLKLLASELNLNEQPLKPLSEAIDTIPDEPGKYYDNYTFLSEMAKDITTKVFYGLVASGAMDEISKSDNIFNKVQQAYYNIQKTINGIGLSREMFKEFSGVSPNAIPDNIKIMYKNTISQESQKIKRTIKMVEDARQEIEKELSKYGITFTVEP